MPLFLPILDCAHCSRKMKRFAAAGEGVRNMTEFPKLAPLVCDKCGEVNCLMEGKLTRKFSGEELEALKQAPIWPVLRDLQSGIRGHLSKGEVH